MFKFVFSFLIFISFLVARPIGYKLTASDAIDYSILYQSADWTTDNLGWVSRDQIAAKTGEKAHLSENVRSLCGKGYVHKFNTNYDSETGGLESIKDRKDALKKTSIALSAIDFENGLYTCEYRKGSSVTSQSYYIKNFKPTLKSWLLEYGLNGNFEKEYLTAITNNFGHLGDINSTTMSGFVYSNLVQVVGHLYIISEVNYFPGVPATESPGEFFEMINKSGSKTAMANNFTEILRQFSFGNNRNKESKAYERATYSQVVIGLMLMDDKYIEKVRQSGDLDLHDNIKTALNFQTMEFESFTPGNKNVSVLKGIVDSFTNDLEDATVQFIQLFSKNNEKTISDQFEQSPFAFYVNVFASLMGIFETIGYTLLLFLVLYYLIITISTIVINKLFPDKASQNSSPISSTKLVALATVFVLGFLTFDSSITYHESVDGKFSDTEAPKVKTTIMKDMITFAAAQGDLLATSLSDYLFANYTLYMQRESLHKITEIATNIDASYKKDMVLLFMESRFYNAGCDKVYRKYLNTHELREKDVGKFSNDINDTALYRQLFSIDGSTIYSDVRPTIVYIKPQLCYDLSDSIDGRVKRIITNIKSLMKIIHTIKPSQSTRLKEYYFSRMLAQYSYGWFNIITIPFLHSFNDVITTILTAMSEGNGANSDNSLRSTLNRSIIDKDINKLEEDITISEVETNDLISNLPYFIMPGFKSIHNKLESIINPQQGQSKMPNRAKMKEMLSSIFAMYGKDISSSVGIVSISAKLYDILVKMLFTVIITIFVVIKIVFWLFDVTKYFFVSPFVVFWGFINDKGQDQIGKFIGRGFILMMIRPILIVITVLLFVVGYEIFYFIYELCLGDIMASLDIIKLSGDIMGETDLNKSVGSLLAGLDSLFQIILLLVLTFVGYKMIMDGDIWILSVLGYSDQAITKNDMSQIAGDLRMKLQNI